MRYHFPAFFVCEGIAEDKPCTHGKEGAGAVGMGVMKVSDPGLGGNAYQPELPEGWKPLRIAAPMVKPTRPEAPHPFASPWKWASETGTSQVGVTCPKCSEHLKIENLVGEAKNARERGSVQ